MPIHSQRLVYAFREGNTFMHDLAAVEPPEGFQKQTRCGDWNLHKEVLLLCNNYF